MSIPTPFLIVLTTLCTIGSQLLLKRAIAQFAHVLRDAGPPAFIWHAALAPGVWMALALQVVGYLVWMMVLARAQLSVAFAISGSFFYLLMAAASWWIFDERLSGVQWGGLILISVGVLMVSLGSGQ